MARKHRKQGILKSPVKMVFIQPETTERKVLTNPETGELEPVTVTTPAIMKQQWALQPTTARGLPNKTTAGKPKPQKMSK